MSRVSRKRQSKQGEVKVRKGGGEVGRVRVIEYSEGQGYCEGGG